MKAGYLSEFFTGVAIKRLSAVEADASRSNQHEFNGDRGLKSLFGLDRQEMQGLFIYLGDNDDEPVVADGPLTWYDAREKHPTRSEHRLYFPTTAVSLCAAEGDLLVIGKRPNDSVLVLIVQGESTIASQVLWLFNVNLEDHQGFSTREELETEQDRIGFAARFILEQIGVPVEATEDTFLDKIIDQFGAKFPRTKEFSAFARSTLSDVNANQNPDAAVMAWMEREEILFRTLEKHIIAERLTQGFHGDVDGFLSFSLSVQNRRKSRVGFALENHMEVVFTECGIRYERGAVSEGRSKPDFIFPGGQEYRNGDFDPALLTMLGVKSTCKDRWRQVLAEAKKIDHKHLLTLEAAISQHQTDQMRDEKLQLVLPKSLHRTYTASQQNWLLDVTGFVDIVRERQVRTGAE
jgi:EcoRII C terminal